MNLFISTKRITNKKISINNIKFNFDFFFEPIKFIYYVK